jgi:HEAT repeat protein
VIGALPAVTMILAAATVLAAISLLSVKLAHRIVLKGRGVRAAVYVAALGEMISRHYVPSRVPSQWATDPVFHDALIDYRRLIEGEDGRFIDHLIQRIGINAALRRRVRRRFFREARLLAISTLVELASPEDIPVLRLLLDDPNNYARTHAAHGLARVGDLESIPTILELCSGVQSWEAGRLADALVLFGPNAVPKIVAWVESEIGNQKPSIEVVAQAARVLGVIGDQKAEPILLELLASPEDLWRLAAASALGSVCSDAARLPLMKALEDPMWEVRARAVRSLAALADPLVSMPVARLLTDREWWVRQNAAQTLAEIPGGLSQLIAALDSSDRFARDSARNQLAELRMLPPDHDPGAGRGHNAASSAIDLASLQTPA